MCCVLFAVPDAMYGGSGGDGGGGGHDIIKLEIFYRNHLSESSEKITELLEARYEDLIVIRDVDDASERFPKIAFLASSNEPLYIFYDENQKRIATKQGPLSLEEIVKIFKDRSSPLAEKVRE
jgi:hypothetical protein